MSKTTYIRGTADSGIPYDLTSPTAKRALVLAGAALALALAALIHSVVAARR